MVSEIKNVYLQCKNNETRPGGFPEIKTITTMIKSTYISTENFSTMRKLTNRVIKAMNDITESDNGTIRNPYDLASVVMEDGRTLIQTIYEDGYVMYNDGWYVVELDDNILYVDLTCKAVSEMGVGRYEEITNMN